MRFFHRLHRDETGGSIVETALMVPVFVVIVYWSALFYDIAQLQLKVEEGARFAAWEMTSHDLSGYANGSPPASFAMAATAARARTDTLYTSLHSENELDESHARLMVDYEYEESEIDNLEFQMFKPAAGDLAGAIDGEMAQGVVDFLDTFDDALGWLLDWLNFNERGLVTSDVGATLRPRLIPERLMQREDGGFYRNQIIDATEYRLSSRAALLADSWTLHYGHDTKPADGYENNVYHRQVERMHMLGLMENTRLGDVVDLVDDIRSLLDFVMEVPLPTDAHLASMNYKAAESPADQTRNLLELPVHSDSRQKNFHTQPIQEVCSGFTCAYADSEYSNTLQSRGSYYMGCPEPQHRPGECNWNEP